jgi:hypothetical protein
MFIEQNPLVKTTWLSLMLIGTKTERAEQHLLTAEKH